MTPYFPPTPYNLLTLSTSTAPKNFHWEDCGWKETKTGHAVPCIMVWRWTRGGHMVEHWWPGRVWSIGLLVAMENKRQRQTSRGGTSLTHNPLTNTLFFRGGKSVTTSHQWSPMIRHDIQTLTDTITWPDSQTHDTCDRDKYCLTYATMNHHPYLPCLPLVFDFESFPPTFHHPLVVADQWFHAVSCKLYLHIHGYGSRLPMSAL